MRFEELRRQYSAFKERAFVPREIFFRSGDRFNHIQIAVRTQKLFAAAAVAVAGWLIYASASYVANNAILVSKDAEIEGHKMAYFDLLTEVSEYHNQFARITEDLGENQTYLLSLLEKNPDNKQKLPAIQRKLRESKTEHARVVIAREGLREKMQQFESDLQQIAERNVSLQSQVRQMKTMLQNSEAARDQVAAARQQLVNRLAQVERDLAKITAGKAELVTVEAGLRAELGSSQDAEKQLTEEKQDLNERIAGLEKKLGDTLAHQTELDSQLAGINIQLAQATGHGKEMKDQRDFLRRRVGGLEQRLVDLRDAEQNVVERLSERTRFSIELVEKTVEMTGLDVNKLIASVRRKELGKGGPFIPAIDEAAEFEPSIQLEASVTVLDQQLHRWAALQEVVRMLPLSVPLVQYRISSGYGQRKDPVNGRKAHHEGVDLSAPMRSSVYATAPGKVVFAGWKGRYGRTIEIDHGHGIRTRYGHLRKILVKVGEKVDNRHKIGLLGSSGRSTGPHVHYEIRYQGRARNPMKFLRAGNHVFKG